MATTKTKTEVKAESKSTPVPTTKLNTKKVAKNHIMALTYWVKIKEAWDNGKALKVTDFDSKMDFDVHGAELVEKSFSADVYETEEKVTKTAMAEKLVNAWNMPFTVEYLKTDGTLRLLRGKLLEPEPLMGRSTVLDFDITSGSPLRLVDHRTISSLILNNVKYILKK